MNTETRIIHEGGETRHVAFRRDALNWLHDRRIIGLAEWGAAQTFRAVLERAQISAPGAMDLINPAIPGNASSAPSDGACDALDELRRIRTAFGKDRASYAICEAVVTCEDTAVQYLVAYSDGRIRRAFERLAYVIGV